MNRGQLASLYEELVGIDVTNAQGTVQFRATASDTGSPGDIAYFTPYQFIQWAYEDWAADTLACTQLRTFSLVLGERNLLLPEDYLMLYRVEFLDGSEYRRLWPITTSELDSRNSRWHSWTGKPQFYVPDLYHFRVLTIYPTPSAAQTIRCHIAYIPAEMTSDSDVPKVPLEYHQALAYQAAYYALRVSHSVPQIKLALEYNRAYDMAVREMSVKHASAGAAYRWHMEAGV